MNSPVELADDSAGMSVATRLLSHNTTAVIKTIEEYGQPVAVTRHNRVVACIAPASATQVVSLMLSRRPAVLAAILAALDEHDRGVEAGGWPTPPDSSGPTLDPQLDGSAGVVDVGIRELSTSTAEVLRAVSAGNVVLLRRNGKLIASMFRCSSMEFIRLQMQLAAELSQSIADDLDKIDANPQAPLPYSKLFGSFHELDTTK